MVREFRLPEGVSQEDMDSNGDGDLLVKGALHGITQFPLAGLPEPVVAVMR